MTEQEDLYTEVEVCHCFMYGCDEFDAMDRCPSKTIERRPVSPRRGTDMTPLMRAMLDDILAHPRDDTLRLIYADLLDDAGQRVHAELIRLQIREPNNPRASDLVTTTWKPQWAANVRYRRGFIWRVDATLEVVLDCLPALRRFHPVERVRVTDHHPARVRSTTEYPAHSTWWQEDAVNCSGGVPARVWNALEGHRAYTPQWHGAKDYDSDRQARLALSRAILKLTGG